MITLSPDGDGAAVTHTLPGPGIAAAPETLMPHGFCYLWQPGLLSLHVVSDTLIGCAYIAISATLWIFVRRSRDVMPFSWMFIMFGAFILACGATHFMEVWTIWRPDYWVSGGVKVVTAIASVSTAVLLPPLLPIAVRTIRQARVTEVRELELERVNADLRRSRAAAEAENAALLASEERYRRLADVSVDGVFISRDGIILETNAAFGRMAGRDRATLIGMRVADLLDPAAQTMASSDGGDDEEGSHLVRWLGADGRDFDGQMNSRPVIFDGAPAQVSILRDVSEWTRLNRLKSEFVSTVSHELRTPLTAIHGALRLLEAGSAGAMAPQMSDMVRIAVANSERLVRLVTDMLDLDKIEAGRLALHRVPINGADVIRTAVDGLRALADSKRMRLEAAGDQVGVFYADRDRIVQVLTNLLSNAIKFGPPDTSITVTASRIARSGGVRFAVTNGGAAIAAGDIPRLFARFHQIDGSDARRHGGTGLGLAISKAIVEEHGGTIGVASADGATTFWFELPGRAAAACARSACTRPRRGYCQRVDATSGEVRRTKSMSVCQRASSSGRRIWEQMSQA
jgi:PAS domain S-box-containing protein